MKPSSTTRPFTIVVEGNIGSGKTTFLDHFKKFSNVSILTEPVDKWRDVKGHNLLQLMYEDPHRWSLTFQSYVQLTMTELHVKKIATPVKMMERSIYSAKNCFVENLHNTGKMPDSEFSVLSEWYDFLRGCPRVDLGVDLFVYLRTSPEVAWERVKRRARSEEKVIPIEYIRELHELHENWLIKKTAFDIPAPVLVIDADQDLAEMPDMFSKHEAGIFAKVRGARVPRSPLKAKENHAEEITAASY